MSIFLAALKSEFVRLARKEVRKEVEGLRKAAAQHRTEIAELKRQVAALAKLVAKQSGKPARQTGEPEGGEAAASIRFSPKGFATHRKRLGLSAAETGILIGVSTPTIYGWEGGTKPRQSQMPAIAAFRGMGKREAQARLAEVNPAEE